MKPHSETYYNKYILICMFPFVTAVHKMIGHHIIRKSLTLINALRHNGHHFVHEIFRLIFLHEKFCILI